MMTYLKNVVTLELDRDMCNGCGRCIEVCPHEVFARNEKTVTIRNRDSCIECGACMTNCVSGAVTVRAGVGCTTAVLNGMIRNGEPDCDCGCGSGDCC